MKKKVIVATHGGAASGLVDSAKMILGDINQELEVYSLIPGMNANDFSKALSREIETHQHTEYIILTDLYGASVCSAMVSLLKHEHVWLFAGMNLNMLLSVCLEYPNELNEQDAEKIVMDARLGVQWVKKLQVENDDF